MTKGDAMTRERETADLQRRAAEWDAYDDPQSTKYLVADLLAALSAPETSPEPSALEQRLRRLADNWSIADGAAPSCIEEAADTIAALMQAKTDAEETR